MKNTLTDLNDHLFAQLERLGDEDLKGEELLQEVNRSKAVIGVGQTIIANGRLVFDAKVHTADLPPKSEAGKLPRMLTGGAEQ